MAARLHLINGETLDVESPPEAAVRDLGSSPDGFVTFERNGKPIHVSGAAVLWVEDKADRSGRATFQ